jgi:hypothetical protein
MRVRELLSAFIEHEERAHLFERSARGVRYWHAIRHDVFQETLQAAGLAERAHLRVGELPIRSWLPAQLRALPTTLRRSMFLGVPRTAADWVAGPAAGGWVARRAAAGFFPRAADLGLRLPRSAARSFGLARAANAWFGLPTAELLVANHPRHIFDHGRFICPYSQPLLDATRRTRVVLEGQFQGRYPTPIPQQPTAYIDLALLAAQAEYRVASWRGHGLSAQDLAELHGIREGLARALGAAPPTAALVRRARTAVVTTLGLWPRYERLLDRVQPRLIVNVIGYRLVNQVLTEVAHARGIQVAELQHGALGASHPSYNFAPGRRPESFPDHLLLFGQLWRNATPGLPLPAAQTPALGYAWLEMQRERYRRLSPTLPKRVLFLSQRTIGRELALAAVRLREACPTDSLHVVYRLHPSEHVGWRDAYPELARAAIEVQAASSAPLYAAQRDVDAQVGVYSTALLEGLAFGLPTYVLALPGHEQLDVITSAGAAQLVPDVETLIDALRGPPPAAPPAADALWAKGATGTFERFLEQTLS